MTVTLRVPPGAHVTADLFRLPDGVRHLATSNGGDHLVIGLPPNAPPGPRVLSVVLSAKPLDLPASASGADAATYLAALSAGVRASSDAEADLASFEIRAAPPRPVAPRPAPQAATAPQPTPRPARSGRCSAILERAQLGDPLSDQDRAVLRGECR